MDYIIKNNKIDNNNKTKLKINKTLITTVNNKNYIQQQQRQ